MSSLATRHPSPATHNEAATASLWDSFRIQMRVIGALLMREVLTRYGRHNIGFLWLFAEPMLFTIGITILWTITGQSKGSGMTITAFALTGYSTILLWRNMPLRCIFALQPNFSLMFHRQVKPIDVYLTRLLLEAVGATTSFVVLTILFYFADLVPLPQNSITLWTAWLLLCWYASAVAMFIGAASERSEVVEKLWHPASYLLIPLSGSFFIVESLPYKLREAILILPTVHCAEMFRDGYFGPAHEWFYSISYVVVFNMVLTLLALAQVRYVSRTLVLSE